MSSYRMVLLALAGLTLIALPRSCANGVPSSPTFRQIIRRSDLVPGGGGIPAGTVSQIAAGSVASVEGPFIPALEVGVDGDAQDAERMPQMPQPVKPPLTPDRPSNVKFRTVWSVKGLDAVDNRLADVGNQVSGEPPDQALCVGNGFMVEAVNTALRVFRTDTGAPVTPVVSLNKFYGYPSEFNRNTLVAGPFATDPSCIYDADTQRFIVTTLFLERDPTLYTFLGPNHVDIAVSKTSDPTEGWWTYKLPTQNDGTEGTPNHNSPGGPALADFPQIGHDHSGFFLTTNEFPLLGGGFQGSNIYAMSKWALAAGAAEVPVYSFYIPYDTTSTESIPPTYSLMPQRLPGSTRDSSPVMYLVSSVSLTTAVDKLVLWTLSGTDTLDTPRPSLTLRVDRLQVPDDDQQVYLPFQRATQKDGPNPYGRALGNYSVGPLDPGGGKVVNTYFAAGKLWGAFTVQGYVDHQLTTGAFVFQIDPVGRKARRVGLLAIPGQHLLFPAVAINSAGKGAVGFTLTGPDYYPSAAYAAINNNKLGSVQAALLGNSPADGFTEYPDADGGFRPRWGDYGAGAVDEAGDVYLGSEWIAAPSCHEITPAPIVCGGTRAFAANWASGIMKVTTRPAANRKLTSTAAPAHGWA